MANDLTDSNYSFTVSVELTLLNVKRNKTNQIKRIIQKPGNSTKNQYAKIIV